MPCFHIGPRAGQMRIIREREQRGDRPRLQQPQHPLGVVGPLDVLRGTEVPLQALARRPQLLDPGIAQAPAVRADHPGRTQGVVVRRDAAGAASALLWRRELVCELRPVQPAATTPRAAQRLRRLPFPDQRVAVLAQGHEQVADEDRPCGTGTRVADVRPPRGTGPSVMAPAPALRADAGRHPPGRTSPVS